MRVIGAGWGRTGTTSLAAGLQRLGIAPCPQMQEMWPHPELAVLFNRYLDGETLDWARLLAGWDATVDWPGCWLWRELADRWPDAVVILSVRDPNEWYSSVRATIHEWTTPGRDLGPPPIRSLLDGLWKRDFGDWDAVLDKDHAISRFLDHNDSVRQRCEPGRLLEWSVENGWVLCAVPSGYPSQTRPSPT
jgi:Sulfotransferase domain